MIASSNTLSFTPPHYYLLMPCSVGTFIYHVICVVGWWCGMPYRSFWVRVEDAELWDRFVVAVNGQGLTVGEVLGGLMRGYVGELAPPEEVAPVEPGGELSGLPPDVRRLCEGCTRRAWKWCRVREYRLLPFGLKCPREGCHT